MFVTAQGYMRVPGFMFVRVSEHKTAKKSKNVVELPKLRQQYVELGVKTTFCKRM